jgi:hypothetical protein
LLSFDVGQGELHKHRLPVEALSHKMHDRAENLRSWLSLRGEHSLLKERLVLRLSNHFLPSVAQSLPQPPQVVGQQPSLSQVDRLAPPVRPHTQVAVVVSQHHPDSQFDVHEGVAITEVDWRVTCQLAPLETLAKLGTKTARSSARPWLMVLAVWDQ